MKIIALTVILVAISCTPQTSYSSFGNQISSENSQGLNTFLEEVDGEAKPFKIKAEVEEVCQKKGCWMTLKNEKGQSIRVTFKDYGFFVPKDIAGREVILEGQAVQSELDEEMARHYAEDAGKEYDPSYRKEISFIAEGVLVADTQE